MIKLIKLINLVKLINYFLNSNIKFLMTKKYDKLKLQIYIYTYKYIYNNLQKL